MFAEAFIHFLIHHKPVDITLLEISPISRSPLLNTLSTQVCFDVNFSLKKIKSNKCLQDWKLYLQNKSCVSRHEHNNIIDYALLQKQYS